MRITNEQRRQNRIKSVRRRFKALGIRACKHQTLKQFGMLRRLQLVDDNGFGTCLTCGERGHYKQLNAGHYITSENMATAFEESNVNLQCVYCNKHRRGNEGKYRKALGDTADELERMSETKIKFKPEELAEMYVDYQARQKPELARIKVHDPPTPNQRRSK